MTVEYYKHSKSVKTNQSQKRASSKGHDVHTALAECVGAVVIKKVKCPTV